MYFTKTYAYYFTNRLHTVIKKIKHFVNSTFFRTFAPYMETSANNNEMSKKRLLGLTTAELKQVAQELGMPAFTGGQIAKWLYEKGVMSIDEMTNLSKANRERLAAEYCVGAMPPIDCQKSVDGTIKYLFPVITTGQSGNSGLFVETVFIPDGDRATLCVSSQVGCKMNCLFCQTGKQGFEGNLTAADILNQIYALPERDLLTNVVFMGAADGYAWSPKRITVSSVGVKNKLKRFLDESQCHVAISMHSPLHDQRLSLMPAEKAMNISDVVELLKQYDFTHQRRCSFEYICFSGLNDTLEHGREIVRLVKGLECRVNLIRFHQIPNVDLPGANLNRMEQLRDYLTANGVFTTIRASRGQDIFAACGLLSTEKKKTQNSH